MQAFTADNASIHRGQCKHPPNTVQTSTKGDKEKELPEAEQELSAFCRITAPMPNGLPAADGARLRREGGAYLEDTARAGGIFAGIAFLTDLPDGLIGRTDHGDGPGS